MQRADETAAMITISAWERKGGVGKESEMSVQASKREREGRERSSERLGSPARGFHVTGEKEMKIGSLSVYMTHLMIRMCVLAQSVFPFTNVFLRVRS